MLGDLFGLIRAPLGPTMLVVFGALCLSYLSLFAACWRHQYGRR